MPRFKLKSGFGVELPGGVSLYNLPGRDEAVVASTAYTTSLVNAGVLEVIDPDAEPPTPAPRYDPVYVERGSDPPALFENRGGGELDPLSLPAGSDSVEGVQHYGTDVALPTGIAADGDAGFFKLGGRVEFFGGIVIDFATPNFADYVTGGLPVLPEMPTGYEMNALVLSNGDSSPRKQVLADTGDTTSRVILPIYYWVGDGPGWYVQPSVIPASATWPPTDDIYIFLADLNYAME